MRPRSEDRLFARYRANCDVTALAGVYDRTASELLRVAMHLSLCPAEAEDLVQATFVAAIQNADSYDPTRPVLPWLLGILSNQAKLARWRNGRSPNPDSLPSERMIDPLEQVQVQEFTRAVDDAIDALPEPYRPVLRLKLKHGFCAAEIAHALGRPPGTVRTQLVRATKLLRQALPSGFTVAVLGISTQARGLAAIRQAVLAEAAAGPTALTMTIGIGGTLLMMKKLVVVVTVCLFALGTTWLYRSWDDSNDIEHVDGTAVAVLDAPTSEHSSESTVLPLQVRHMVPKLAVAESRHGAIAATKGQHVFLGCVREELSRRGLNGVRVTLSRRNSTQLIASTITNDEGSFGLDAVPTDADLTVTLSKNGYATRGYFLHFEAGSRQVTRDFEMGFGVLIQGTVSDYTTGAPISRAEIFDRGSSLAKLCISEEGGRFSFRLQPMGGEKKLAFHIRADGYCKITSKYTVAELGPHSDLRITLPRQCGVRGIVRDSSGKVLQGAQVVVLPGPHHKRKPSPLDALWKRWRHEVRSIGCKTNEDGEYAVTTLMPWTGPYKVRTVKKGYQTQFNALTGLGAPGDVKELQVTLENLQPGARISGFLTLNGKPCRGGIEWKGPTRNGRILLKGGDSAGFTMTVEAGRVEFLAHLSSNWGPEELWQIKRVLHVDEGAEYELAFPIKVSFSHVGGQVRSADGKPVANSVVQAFCSPSIHTYTKTDKEGRYSMEVPAAHGPYSLSRGNGFGRQTRKGVLPGQTGVDFVVPKLGTLKFKIQEDGQDQRLGFFTLFASKPGSDDSGYVHGPGRPDAHGWQSLQVPVGLQDLLLAQSYSGYSPVWVRGVNVASGKQTTSIVFHVVSGMRLDFSLAQGQELMPKGCICAILTRAEAAKMQVQMKPTGPAWSGTRNLPGLVVWSRSFDFTKSRKRTIQGVPPGEYLIKAYGANIEVEPKTISIGGKGQRAIQIRWHRK